MKEKHIPENLMENREEWRLIGMHKGNRDVGVFVFYENIYYVKNFNSKVKKTLVEYADILP